MSIKINDHIPRTMTRAGLHYLGQLAQTVPENGIIVEVGPLFGSSTWVLAQNAHPSVQVYSIDTWERAPWIIRMEEEHKGCLKFSIDAFKEYTKDCPNVIAIQGWSPDVVSDWDGPINLFFDDASHGNPGFINNLNFFIPKVVPHGIVCGDDYAGGWPDIVREVDILATGWNANAEIVGRVWALAKPADENSQTVHDLLPSSGEPELQLQVSTKSGKLFKASPQTWCGALHKSDPICDFIPNWKNKIDGLEVAYQLFLNSKRTSPWLKSGEKFQVRDDELVTGIKAQLVGDKAKFYRFEYQLGYCLPSNPKKRLSNSKAVTSGFEIQADQEGVAVNAVRMTIQSR